MAAPGARLQDRPARLDSRPAVPLDNRLGLVGQRDVRTAVGKVEAEHEHASLSRGGWLGLAAVLAALMVGGWGLAKRPARLLVGSLLVVGGLTGLGLTLAGAWPAAVEQRLAGLTAVDGRALLWQGSLDIWRRHPVCGAGLETFQIAFCEVRTPAYWQANRAAM